MVLRIFFLQDTEALAGVGRFLGLGMFRLGWPLWAWLGWHTGC